MTLPLKRNYKTDTTATLEKKISDWNSCRNICKCITATTNAYNTCVGCFQYFAFRELARRCTNVLSKTKSTRTRQGPLSPNGSQVLRRLQYNTMLLILQPGAQAPTIQYIAYISTSRWLDAYNTIQCLDYDQVLRRLIYCFAD